MSIKKLKRKKGYVHKVRLKRNGVEYTGCFDRQYDAQQYEQEVRYSGCDNFDVKYTFEQASNDWMTNHAEVRKAPRSVHMDKQMLRDNLLPYFGPMPLRQIAPEMIDRFIQKLRKRTRAISTINRNLELLRAIFYYAIKRRKAIYNPMVAVGLLKTQDPPFNYWEQHEGVTFLRYVEGKCRRTGSDLAFLYKIALNTGMRLGEILGLGWEDVDFTSGLIRVRRSYDSYLKKVKDTTKGYKIRHVPINSAICEELRQRRATRTGDLVFATINGKPKDGSNVTHYFYRDIKEAGLRRIRFHDMRHTYASHFMMNGGDIYHLKEILGHSDIKTTMRYAHLSKSFLVDKADTVCFTTDKNIVRVDFGKKAVSQ